MEDFHICPVTNYYKRILLPVSYSLVFVLGLTLNGALVWCLCARTRRWSSTVIYMANLAVADLLYVLALPPLIISNAMGDLWPFGNIICKSVRFFFFVNLHCSMMFLSSISLHRFVGVCFPIAAVRLRTKKLALFASGSVWILATAEILPTLVFAHTVGFLVPFLVVVTCYCSMMKVLYCKVAGSISNARAARGRKNSLYTLIVVCLMFVVCFVPYHIARTVYLFVRVYLPGECHLLNVVMISYKVWKPVVSFNCCANPSSTFWALTGTVRSSGPGCAGGRGCSPACVRKHMNIRTTTRWWIRLGSQMAGMGLSGPLAALRPVNDPSSSSPNMLRRSS
ncbi:hypothetical protein INR49_003394 [Caranx melampygus]|nr:hypothetical protein INR49_003394 [Caranx melampygus]